MREQLADFNANGAGAIIVDVEDKFVSVIRTSTGDTGRDAISRMRIGMDRDREASRRILGSKCAQQERRMHSRLNLGLCDRDALDRGLLG